MSGHSKWAQIKHKKAATDAKRSKVFSRLAALITIAAREKGGDLNMNPKLRMVVEKARSNNMPADNIERAIKRGVGGGQGQALEEIMIEAYGPGGKAMLIEAITDNRNRTISEIKHILSKNNGKMANAGSVKWMFEEKGKISAEKTKIEEDLELKLIESGAEDIDESEEELIIMTKPENLEIVKQVLIESNINVKEAILAFIAKNPEALNEGDKKSWEKIFDELDEHQDVGEIYTNAEF